MTQQKVWPTTTVGLPKGRGYEKPYELECVGRSQRASSSVSYWLYNPTSPRWEKDMPTFSLSHSRQEVAVRDWTRHDLYYDVFRFAPLS